MLLQKLLRILPPVTAARLTHNKPAFRAKTMQKATFTGPGQPLKVVEDVIPEVPAGGALIRTTYSGICHSDVHLRKDQMDYGDGQIFSFTKIFGDKYLGTTFGHEISGVIVDFGDGADPASQDLKIGDKVVVYPWIGCQTCDTCQIGSNNLCEFRGPKDIGINPAMNGGYATHVPVPQCRYLIKIPDTLPESIACMLPCSGATAYASLLKVTPRVQQAIKARGQANLLVIGAGGLGLWCIQLAKKALFPNNNVKVFVADITEDKISMAVEAGADEGFVWGMDESVPDIIQKSTKKGQQKMDAVINFVGNAKTSDIGLNSLHNGGILVVIGLAGGSLSVKLAVLAVGSKAIIGCKTSTLGELTELVELVSTLKLDYQNLQFVQLDEVNSVLDELQAGIVRGRKIIKFD